MWPSPVIKKLSSATTDTCNLAQTRGMSKKCMRMHLKLPNCKVVSNIVGVNCNTKTIQKQPTKAIIQVLNNQNSE